MLGERQRYPLERVLGATVRIALEHAPPIAPSDSGRGCALCERNIGIVLGHVTDEDRVDVDDEARLMRDAVGDAETAVAEARAATERADPSLDEWRDSRSRAFRLVEAAAADGTGLQRASRRRRAPAPRD